MQTAGLEALQVCKFASLRVCESAGLQVGRSANVLCLDGTVPLMNRNWLMLACCREGGDVDWQCAKQLLRLLAHDSREQRSSCRRALDYALLDG